MLKISSQMDEIKVVVVVVTPTQIKLEIFKDQAVY